MPTVLFPVDALFCVILHSRRLGLGNGEGKEKELKEQLVHVGLLKDVSEAPSVLHCDLELSSISDFWLSSFFALPSSSNVILVILTITFNRTYVLVVSNRMSSKFTHSSC